MSRKCPKRHHQFLNWLRTNRSRFPFEPHVTRIENREIDVMLRGLNKTLRFQFTPRAWIAVDAAIGSVLRCAAEGWLNGPHKEML